MFSPFVIFIMIVSVFVALIADIFDPFSSLLNSSRGKTGKQIGDSMEDVAYVHNEKGEKVLDEDGTAKVNWKKIGKKAGGWCSGACLYVAFVLPLSLLITYVVEPIVFISAITQKIGIPYLAYAMLGIIVISVVVTISSLSKAMKSVFKKDESAKEPGPDATTEERLAYKIRKDMEKEVTEKKVVITTGGWILSILRRIFFALPDLYLVYLIVLALMPKG